MSVYPVRPDIASDSQHYFNPGSKEVYEVNDLPLYGICLSSVPWRFDSVDKENLAMNEVINLLFFVEVPVATKLSI